MECEYRSSHQGRTFTYNVTNVVGDFEFTVGAGALRMNHTFGNALTVEVCQEVDQMEILQEQRAIGTNALSCLGVHDLTRYQRLLYKKEVIDRTGQPLDAV